MKICPVPWDMLALKNNGDFRVCCHANVSEAKGLLYSNNGEKKLNCSNSSFDSARNSETFNELRLELLAGRWPSSCERCQKDESCGLTSRRQHEISKMPEIMTPEYFRSVTDNEGRVDLEKSPLRRMDIRFGNKCNLKCRMCGPTDSSAWYEDHNKLWNRTEFYDGVDKIDIAQSEGTWKALKDPYLWVEDSRFWDEFKKNLENLTYIHMVGGEPLLIDKHFDILKKCIDKDYAKNITLEYNTNLTTFNEHVVKLWANFKHVKVGVSLDGNGAVNDYIRYPSRWNKIQKNLEQLENSNLDNLTVWLSCTIQALNVLNLKDFFSWKLHSNFHSIKEYKHKSIISTHLLHSPSFLSIQVFSKSMKVEITQQLVLDCEQLCEEILKLNVSNAYQEIYTKHVTSLFKGVINFMNLKDESHELNVFQKHCERLDEIRHQRLKDYIPKLHTLIYDY